MIQTEIQNFPKPLDARYFEKFLIGTLLFLCSILTIHAQENLKLDKETNTLTVEEVQEGEIYAFGKNVIVKKGAKGIFAFGGNIFIEGRIEGDVGVIGGSIYQKQGAFIGGDVIVFGGTYNYEDNQPLRNPGNETIMFASYEEELRNISQNPAQIFAPSLSWSFLIQRFLSVLFWFVISLALTTIAPGAVSRSVARLHLSALKIAAIGFLGFITATIGIVTVLKFLPDFLSAIISLMSLALIILAYVFGRVALQVSAGKWFLKRFSGDRKRSESAAILTGTLIWTLLLSIPYIWVIVLFTLFIASLGIVLTARLNVGWETA